MVVSIVHVHNTGRYIRYCFHSKGASKHVYAVLEVGEFLCYPHQVMHGLGHENAPPGLQLRGKATARFSTWTLVNFEDQPFIVAC